MYLNEVIAKLETLYPPSRACSWDNVGHLLKTYPGTKSPQCKLILLTIDVTPAVVREAIEKEVQLIYSYHPVFFRDLGKFFTVDNWKHKIISDCIKNNIDIYSYHTSLDMTENGINLRLISSILPDVKALSLSSPDFETFIKQDPHLKNIATMLLQFEEKPAAGPLLAYSPNGINILDLTEKLKKLLKVDHCQVIQPNYSDHKNNTFNTFGICVGSGASEFSKLVNKKIDCLITGEMTHHNTLDIISQTQYAPAIILLGHCNTERFYLDHLKNQLDEEFLEQGVEFLISQSDASPFVTR